MPVFLNHDHFIKDSSSGVATTRLKAMSCQMEPHAERLTASNSNFHTWMILHVWMDNGAHFQNATRVAQLPRAPLVSTSNEESTLSLLCTVRENYSLKPVQAISLFNAERTSVKEQAETRDGTKTKTETPSIHQDRDVEKSCVQVQSVWEDPNFQLIEIHSW